MIRYLRRRGRASRGQALVETAIALPLILLLSLATFDLGRGIVSHIALTEAVQEGSLFAAHEYGGYATTALADAAVTTRIVTSSNSDPVTSASVTLNCAAGAEPGTIALRASYELPLISPPARFLFGSTLTLGVDVTATNFHEDGCP